MLIGAKTDRGRVREQNEDTYGYRDSLFVVADGMGGHRAGEIASAIAVEAILSVDFRKEVYSSLKDAVLKANQAILDEVAACPDRIGMGTTVALLYLDDSRAYFTHIGDSRIYLLSKGSLIQLTDDHSLVAELVRNGGLTLEEAKIHPQRNILTRALGTETELEIDVNSVPTHKGDKFLLCSDGLTGMLDEVLIKDFLSQEEKPERIVENLVDAANQRGGNDNITVILIEI